MRLAVYIREKLTLKVFTDTEIGYFILVMNRIVWSRVVTRSHATVFKLILLDVITQLI